MIVKHLKFSNCFKVCLITQHDAEAVSRQKNGVIVVVVI